MSTNPSLDRAASVISGHAQNGFSLGGPQASTQDAPEAGKPLPSKTMISKRLMLYRHLIAPQSPLWPLVRFSGPPSRDEAWHAAPVLLAATNAYAVWPQSYTERLYALKAIFQRDNDLLDLEFGRMSDDEAAKTMNAKFILASKTTLNFRTAEEDDGKIFDVPAQNGGHIWFSLEGETDVLSRCKKFDVAPLELDLCAMLFFGAGIPTAGDTPAWMALQELANVEFNYTLWRFLRFRRDVFGERISPNSEHEAVTLIEANYELLLQLHNVEKSGESSIDLMKSSMIKRQKHLFNDVRRIERRTRERRRMRKALGEIADLLETVVYKGSEMINIYDAEDEQGGQDA